MQIFLNIIAVLFRILSNSFGNVLQKQLTNNYNRPSFVNCANYLILSCVCILFAPFIHWTNLSLEFFIYGILGGITGAIANCFMVMALMKGDLSVLGPINSYKAVIGLIASIVILHEIPNFCGIFGIFLIIFGSYFIFDTLEEKFSLKVFRRKDIQYRIFALIFSAIEAVFIKKVIILSSISISFVTTCITGLMFSFLIMKIFRINIKEEFRLICKKSTFLYLLTALSFGIMTYTTAYVFKHINVGYALALFQLSIILNLFLGYKIFNEKNIKKKLLGSVIILLGSTIIILLGN